jgi:hypothetical protein
MKRRSVVAKDLSLKYSWSPAGSVASDPSIDRSNGYQVLDLIRHLSTTLAIEDREGWVRAERLIQRAPASVKKPSQFMRWVRLTF